MSSPLVLVARVRKKSPMLPQAVCATTVITLITYNKSYSNLQKNGIMMAVQMLMQGYVFLIVPEISPRVRAVVKPKFPQQHLPYRHIRAIGVGERCFHTATQPSSHDQT